ncbi:MAG: thioredoxin domain-containing protein [Sphingomicrobium sp.]
MGIVAAAIAAAVPLANPALAAPQKRAVATNWSRLVVATPEGGFRMGNPKARVKLVEYASLTCPHCRAFALTGVTPLVAQHVRTGKVSYEFRNFVLNGVDIAVTLVARCGGARTFFPIVDGLYAAQPTWLGRVTALSEAQNRELESLPTGARLARVAQAAGILPIAAKHGVTPAAARRCLADPAALKRVGTMAEAATARGVTATPTFYVNGKAADARDWESLQPLLKAAGR